MDYDQMLAEAMQKVEPTVSSLRLRVPKPVAEKAGLKTILVNFIEIASTLKREPDHLLKFFSKELATKGEMVSQRPFFIGAFSSEKFQEKLNLYIKEFVLCPKCGRPDTHIEHEKHGSVIRCDACGNKSPIKKV